MKQIGKDGRNSELERLYRVEDDEEENEVGNESGEDDAVVQRELERAERGYDPARDGGFSESSSSEESTDDESESDSEKDVAEETFEYPDRQGDDLPQGEVTARLAVVNLDWDHIRAADLLAVFSSFAPEGGRILKAAVYPSEFGRERMDREAIEGPPKDIFPTAEGKDEDGKQDVEAEDVVSEDEEDEERIRKSILKQDTGEEFNPTLLRRYQLERLRYYYAVLICSSPACAEAIYSAVDGLEYLATANFFDLRFVPDTMDFAADKPRDECEAIPARYRPNEFVTDALQHSRVKLTWDADDGKRREVQKRAFGGNRAEIDENDLRAYLGSDSSDEEAEAEGRKEAEQAEEDKDATASGNVSKKEQERQRMRSLLGLGAESEPRKAKGSDAAPVGDMQITFSSGLSEQPGDSGPRHSAAAEETTVEKYRRKEKERKMRRKATAKGIAPDGMNEEVAGEGEDQGFADPFFEDLEEAVQAAKEAVRKKKKKAAAAAVAQPSAQETAKLQKLTEPEDGAADGVGHFDMSAIEKGEKALKRLKKAKRRGRTSVKEQEALEMKRNDRFEIDVHDPRFGAIYERSEFALDPSHPRFKGTEGMKQLLEEGRRKRAAEMEGDEGAKLRRLA